jgi:hypothetical protein
LKTGEGLDRVIEFIFEQGMLADGYRRQ